MPQLYGGATSNTSNTVKQWLNTCPVVWCVTIFGLECGRHSGTHPRLGSGLTGRRPPLSEDMSPFLEMVVDSKSVYRKRIKYLIKEIKKEKKIYKGVELVVEGLLPTGPTLSSF